MLSYRISLDKEEQMQRLPLNVFCHVYTQGNMLILEHWRYQYQIRTKISIRIVMIMLRNIFIRTQIPTKCCNPASNNKHKHFSHFYGVSLKSKGMKSVGTSKLSYSVTYKILFIKSHNKIMWPNLVTIIFQIARRPNYLSLNLRAAWTKQCQYIVSNQLILPTSKPI